ncbi:uncharacterized protein BO88DRAFT_343972 [Aspergillus vadensis CBS 113365]|uniref:Condensation domain-containing protein n=1 Tax=Aspergillus vadensis (strain CBS 113365 / IMI 142717 / IBT 24658) TaxID=1448311 RepID=A0A319B554_ASPVC|nr:hypothetical protein BO88DRAFT_343972 [Aspergillus vadensis CBS 113365]PYH67529.1 hypothetical protein BO88DRAFT_343972 [Aspergillus vadensis CBS 113365]
MPKTWGRVSEKQYTRPVDGIEAVMRQMVTSNPPGRRTYDIAAVAKVRTTLTTEELTKKGRLAWQNLRYKHPLMASSVVDGNWIYNVPCSKGLESWTQKTFLSVDKTPKRIEDVLNRLGPVELPIMFHLKDRNEFLLNISHYHADGQGIAIWFHDFLTELSCPKTDTLRWEPGDEVKNLPLETRDAAAIPRLTQPWVEDHRGFFPKNQPKASKTLGLEIEPDASQRQLTFRFERRRFSVNETETIFAKARNLGLTPTPLAHTAIALAAKDQANLPDGVQHNTFLISSLRGQCKGPPELGSRAMAPRFGLWPIQVGVHDFPKTSKALKECYSSFKSNMSSYIPIMTHVLADMGADVSNDVLSTLIISNMGDASPYIQSSYDEIELEDYWAITLPANPSIVFIIESRLDQLEIRISYNNAYHDPSQIRSFMDSICKILLEAP